VFVRVRVSACVCLGKSRGVQVGLEERGANLAASQEATKQVWRPVKTPHDWRDDCGVAVCAFCACVAVCMTIVTGTRRARCACF
jgi:hypothetical protein